MKIINFHHWSSKISNIAVKTLKLFKIYLYMCQWNVHRVAASNSHASRSYAFNRTTFDYSCASGTLCQQLEECTYLEVDMFSLFLISFWNSISISCAHETRDVISQRAYIQRVYTNLQARESLACRLLAKSMRFQWHVHSRLY